MDAANNGVVHSEENGVGHDELVVQAMTQGLNAMNETLRQFRNDFRVFAAAVVIILIIAFAVALNRNVNVSTPVGGVQVTSTAKP